MEKPQNFVLLMGRVELFRDFSMNLLYYIDKYYIDYESLNTRTDIYNHLMFCYNKVCDEFLLEGIDFRNNSNLKKYYFNYYLNQYYRNQNENGRLLSYHEKFWTEIFGVRTQKNKNILIMLVELYNIFDITINNKNILEFA